MGWIRIRIDLKSRIRIRTKSFRIHNTAPACLGQEGDGLSVEKKSGAPHLVNHVLERKPKNFFKLSNFDIRNGGFSCILDKHVHVNMYM
jgi:hypothetical protein